MRVPGMSAKRMPRTGDLRVVMLNVWGWYHPTDNGTGYTEPGTDSHPAWKARRTALQAGLSALEPDLVAFQEVIHSDVYDQVVDLLGPGYHVAHQLGREPDGSGTSIASRWPLDEVREVDQHVTARTGEFPCTTLVAEVIPPEPVEPLLFATHNPNFQLNFEYERELQAVAGARLIEDWVGDRPVHVVLAGDFDATPDAASMRFWRGRQSLDGTSVCYRDAWESVHPGEPGHTFSRDNPMMSDGNWARDVGRRIDYILVRCGRFGPTMRIAACDRIFDEPVDGVWASDHFGVVADLAWPLA